MPRISSRNSGRRCSTGSSIGICPRSPIRLSSSALSASAGSYRPAATRCGCGRALFLFGIGQNPSLYENKCLCSGQPPCQILVGVVDCRSAFDPGRRTLSGDARRDARRTVDAVYRRAARRRNYGYRAGRLQQRYAARLGLDARDGNHGTFAGDYADGHAHRVGRGTLIYVVGFWILFRAFWALGEAYEFRRYTDGSWLIILAVLAIIFSFFFLVSPAWNGLFIVSMISLAFFAYGIYRITHAFALRSLEKE